jgi:hypothetical protein
MPGVMELMGKGKVTGNGRRREDRPEIEDDWQVGPTCRRGGGPPQRTVSGICLMGRGLASAAGLVWFPGVQNVFIRFVSFLFFFSGFLFEF